MYYPVTIACDYFEFVHNETLNNKKLCSGNLDGMTSHCISRSLSIWVTATNIADSRAGIGQWPYYIYFLSQSKEKVFEEPKIKTISNANSYTQQTI